MTYGSIKVVRIDKVFAEFNSKAIEKLNLKDVISAISKPNELDSLYEYLESDLEVRFFMDIENICVKSTEIGDSIVEQIIWDFIEFTHEFNININTVAITKNFKSENHNGQSFHVIFISNNRICFRELKYWMNAFLALYPSNQKYVDTIVYKDNRMFKLPNQYGVNKEGIHIREKSSNIHVPYRCYEYEYNDWRKREGFVKFTYIKKRTELNINENTLGNFIIQSPSQEYLMNRHIGYPFNRDEALKIKFKNISQEGSVYKKKANIQKINQLESEIDFKCLKFKIMTSYDERVKFVDDVMKFREDHKTVNLLKRLTIEQIDQLLDIALNSV